MRLPSYTMQIVRVVTRWGLFLMRGGSSSLESRSLWKARTATQVLDANSRSSFTGRYCSDPEYAVLEALSKELDSPNSFDDDYQIESSTDVCPCKKRCHC
jgi:hypothetical protein